MFSFGLGLSWIHYVIFAAFALVLVAWAYVIFVQDSGDDDTPADGESIVDVIFKQAGNSGDDGASTRDDEDEANVETGRVEEVVFDDGAIEHPRPNIRTSSFGLVEEFFRFYRRRSKERKLARKGYVKWHLTGETFSRPKFIKPEAKNGGIPEFEYNGDTYLFPRGAAVADESSGMWTFVHKPGDADPINLRDPMRTSIPADELKEYLTLRVSSDPPSWLDSLSLDPQKLLMGAMGLIVLIAVLNRMVL